MAKFNTTATNKLETTNHEGGKAFKLSPELELYSLVCTASLSNKFYETQKETMARLRKLLKLVDSNFSWNLAFYAREQMHLRSVPIVLAVELTKLGHTNWQGVARVIQRADEITELLAYYESVNGSLKPLANSIKKGIAHAFHKFDEYQFAKYNRDGRVKLRDALFISHPKPSTPEQEALFKRIAESELEIPYTWETQLSEAGKSGKDKAVVWEELIDSKKVGYMALLRNLRNILNAGVSNAHIENVCEYLTNANAVANSKQLPFRFYAAHQELVGNSHGLTHMVLDALETAIGLSFQNMPGFDINTKVLISTDTSGSMTWGSITDKSKMRPVDVGAVLAAAAASQSKNVVTSMFADRFKTVQLRNKDNILANAGKLSCSDVGHGTAGHTVLQWANQQGREFDKIFIFTDMQMYRGSLQTEWAKYKKRFPGARLYMFDLNGYGTATVNVMHEKGVNLIAGWSDKVFAVMEAIEQGQTAVDIISSYL